MQSLIICGNPQSAALHHHHHHAAPNGASLLLQDPSAAAAAAAATLRLPAHMMPSASAPPLMGMGGMSMPSFHAAGIPTYPIHLSMTDPHITNAAMAGPGMSAVIVGPTGQVSGIVPLSATLAAGMLHHPASYAAAPQPAIVPSAPTAHHPMFHMGTVEQLFPYVAAPTTASSSLAYSHPSTMVMNKVMMMPGTRDLIQSTSPPSNPDVDAFFHRLDRAPLSSISVLPTTGDVMNQQRHVVPQGVEVLPENAKSTRTENAANPSSKKSSKSSDREKLKKVAHSSNQQDRRSKDKPKRPLSAYNCFFKEERARILGSIPDMEGGAPAASSTGSKRRRNQHGKISFEDLGKTIGRRWQNLSPEEAAYYKRKADEDMKRYRLQMADFLAKHENGAADTPPVASIEVVVTKEDPDPVAEVVSDHEEATTCTAGPADGPEDDQEDDLPATKRAKLEGEQAKDASVELDGDKLCV